ncbi:uncharacterized protein BYT42DRAFT_551296 [Radiomyces spectabilis]|uniref:uncharacterized protein n=1 Tax=Radiomyces spectabilis TaxID=64574 RepID=UPI0022202E3D|nr:uncharacterized protein BYT42DRAFT_551296 [Radiomyces spectabilis]KAI8393509.1 hypothetical protein BYT42DRAFT_551296 [Radiomyces spectabilis]
MIGTHKKPQLQHETWTVPVKSLTGGARQPRQSRLCCPCNPASAREGNRFGPTLFLQLSTMSKLLKSRRRGQDTIDNVYSEDEDNDHSGSDAISDDDDNDHSGSSDDSADDDYFSSTEDEDDDEEDDEVEHEHQVEEEGNSEKDEDGLDDNDLVSKKEEQEAPLQTPSPERQPSEPRKSESETVEVIDYMTKQRSMEDYTPSDGTSQPTESAQPVSEREKRIEEHREYRKKLAQDPSFVPYVGQFWGHDDRYREDTLRTSSEHAFEKAMLSPQAQDSRLRHGRRTMLRNGRTPEEIETLLSQRWTHDGFEELMRLEEQEERNRRNGAERREMRSQHSPGTHRYRSRDTRRKVDGETANQQWQNISTKSAPIVEEWPELVSAMTSANTLTEVKSSDNPNTVQEATPDGWGDVEKESKPVTSGTVDPVVAEDSSWGSLPASAAPPAEDGWGAPAVQAQYDSWNDDQFGVTNTSTAAKDQFGSAKKPAATGRSRASRGEKPRGASSFNKQSPSSHGNKMSHAKPAVNKAKALDEQNVQTDNSGDVKTDSAGWGEIQVPVENAGWGPTAALNDNGWPTEDTKPVTTENGWSMLAEGDSVKENGWSTPKESKASAEAWPPSADTTKNVEKSGWGSTETASLPKETKQAVPQVSKPALENGWAVVDEAKAAAENGWPVVDTEAAKENGWPVADGAAAAMATAEEKKPINDAPATNGWGDLGTLQGEAAGWNNTDGWGTSAENGSSWGQVGTESFDAGRSNQTTQKSNWRDRKDDKASNEWSQWNKSSKQSRQQQQRKGRGYLSQKKPVSEPVVPVTQADTSSWGTIPAPASSVEATWMVPETDAAPEQPLQDQNEGEEDSDVEIILEAESDAGWGKAAQILGIPTPPPGVEIQENDRKSRPSRGSNQPRRGKPMQRSPSNRPVATWDQPKSSPRSQRRPGYDDDWRRRDTDTDGSPAGSVRSSTPSHSQMQPMGQPPFFYQQAPMMAGNGSAIAYVPLMPGMAPGGGPMPMPMYAMPFQPMTVPTTGDNSPYQAASSAPMVSSAGAPPGGFEANGMVYYGMDASTMYPYYYYPAPVPMHTATGSPSPHTLGLDPASQPVEYEEADEGWGIAPDHTAHDTGSGQSAGPNDSRDSAADHQTVPSTQQHPPAGVSYDGQYFYYPASPYYN